MSNLNHRLALAAVIIFAKATFAACPEKIMNISPKDYDDCEEFYNSLPDSTWLYLTIHLVASEPSFRRIWVDSLYLKYDFRDFMNRSKRLSPPPDSSLHQDEFQFWRLETVRAQHSTVKMVVTESFVRDLELSIGEVTTSIQKSSPRTGPTQKSGSNTYDANGRVYGKEGQGASRTTWHFKVRSVLSAD